MIQRFRLWSREHGMASGVILGFPFGIGCSLVGFSTPVFLLLMLVFTGLVYSFIWHEPK